MHIILKWNTFTCHNIIAFCSILIARMDKPTCNTKKTIQAKIGSLVKAGTKGKKRSTSLQNISLPISNKKRRVEGLHPISLILMLTVLTMILILLLTKMMMLSLLVFQITPSYPCKNHKMKLLMMI